MPRLCADVVRDLEEAHGISVFYKDGTGDVFHTYSSYARGPEMLLGMYYFL